MEIAVFYFNLCVFHTLASSIPKKEVLIRVSPNRSQFFQYEQASLSCEDSAGGSKLKRNTTTRGTETCPYGWGSLLGSTCAITTLYPSDTGVYWCESSSGQHSQTVYIKVIGGSVILESPVLPVMEGDNVTLRCTNRMPFFFNVPTEFYKDGHLIRSSSTGNMAIHTVSKSDAGQYKCKIPEAGDSPDSWLTVRDRASDPADPDAPAAPVISVSRIICHLVIATPYVLSTIILGLIYRDKRRAHQVVAEDRRHNVIMELE